MSSNDKNEARYWESAQDHRFALEVLQLPLRRKMLSFIAGDMRSNCQIERELGLAAHMVEYHLQMLEKALVIERAEGGWRASTTGLLYLKNVEKRL